MTGRTSTKTCALDECDTTFVPTGNQLYCSYKHKERAKKRRQRRRNKSNGNCPQCGSSDYDASQPYCDECSDYFHNRYKRQREMSR